MMKRISKSITCLLLAGLIMSGCKNNHEVLPNEVFASGEVISYYDLVSTLSENFDKLDIVVDKDEKIRSISITDDSFITYKNVVVGDSLNDVLEKFKYEYQNGERYYMVLIDGETEKNPDDINKKDDWIWLNYYFKEDKLTKIVICDVMYGREMR